MSTPIGRLFAAFSDVWRGIALVALIVAAGFTAGLTLAGWWQLPKRLLLLEAHQTISDSIAGDLAAQLGAIKRLTRQQLCLTVADRKKTPWEDCLIGDYKP